MRTHREGQRDKSQEGGSFQKTNHRKLIALLEREGLDDRFTVEGQQRLAMRSGKTIKPDHIIRSARGRIVACGGSKKSWRERWKEDDRDALLLKMDDPSVFWIEFHGCEYDNDTPDRLERFLEGIHRNSAFDAVCSHSSPASMIQGLSLLVKHLKGL